MLAFAIFAGLPGRFAGVPGKRTEAAKFAQSSRSLEPEPIKEVRLWPL